jgi:hypothetical protein
MPDPLAARTVLSVALNSRVDLDKPVLIKLGLYDERTIEARYWSTKGGHLVLTLDEDHDFFPIARYVLGAPDRSAMRTGTEHKTRGMFASPEDREVTDA